MGHRYCRIEILFLTQIFPHEETISSEVGAIALSLAQQEYVGTPILVDESSNVILDGHHRVAALLQSGYHRVPAARVPYGEGDTVRVVSRPGAGTRDVSKLAVVQAGTVGPLFSAKSTRHSLSFSLPAVRFPLARLR